MKELEPFKRPEIEFQAKDKQEYKLIGSVRRIPGLRLFMLDTYTMEVEEVRVNTEVTLDMKNPGELKKSHKSATHYNQNNLYTQALNKANAERKFLKLIRELQKQKNYETT